MTERGLPIVDGAPACPFVAFEDDRDARALAPDHRHRCYAEARPAPRALAHQEAYCLSSAFPVCPTFQDWARREAAAARPAAASEAQPRDEPPVSRPMPPLEREPRHAQGEAPPPLPPRRNPPRSWAAPPPWSEYDQRAEDAEAEPPSFLARDPERDWGAASAGLAGSAADRVARAGRPELDDDLDQPAPPRRPERGARPSEPAWAPANDDEEDEEPVVAPPPRRRPAEAPSRRQPGASAQGERARRRAEEEAAELFGPAWERPRRYEAYPTLRTRMGLPGIPRAIVYALALVLAAVVLFFVGPMLLGLGGPGGGTGSGPTPSPSAAPSASVAPTPTPAPTQTVYIVAANDTMSGIAKRFGVTLDALRAANPKIKDVDKIKIGDEIIIPLPEPDDGGEASAGPSAAP